jgi:RimJ/RimL family protein N-acetyltransferase
MIAMDVRLEAWSAADLELLRKLVGDPAMMGHLGGPESDAKILERQGRYERMAGASDGQMLKIVDATTGEGIGSVGYWERAWRDLDVYEIGWSVIPAFQGRGLATVATGQMIELARANGRRRFLHAFPSVDNRPSNAICRKLGFTLLGPLDFEYPKGHPLRCNDWQLDVRAGGP